MNEPSNVKTTGSTQQKETIMVVGTGLMGRGIAQVAAQSGHPVVFYNRRDESLDRAVDLIAAALESLIKKGRLDEAGKNDALGRIVRTTNLADAHGADFIIETVVENRDTKEDLFAALDRFRRDGVVIATNTSSFPISALAAATKHPERFIGMHFFSPVPAMRLVEIVPGDKTDEQTVRKAEAIAASLGKETVRVKDVPGFLINRINAAFRAEVYQCLLEGVASMEDIDKAIRLGLNHPMGPFELTDQIGLEIGYQVFNTLHAGYRDPKFRPSLLLEKLVNQGELGRKTGKGWYDYTSGEKRPRKHTGR